MTREEIIDLRAALSSIARNPSLKDKPPAVYRLSFRLAELGLVTKTTTHARLTDAGRVAIDCPTPADLP